MNPILMTEQDLLNNPMLGGITAGDQILQQIQPVAIDAPIDEMQDVPMPPKPSLDNNMLPMVDPIMGGLPPQETMQQQIAQGDAEFVAQQEPRGFFQQISDYAQSNAGDLLARGINQINENYMTDNMSVENYLKYQNVKNEKEIAEKKNILDSLALEQDMRYKAMDLEVKRENLAQQRMILMSQLSGQNIQNMIGMQQLGVNTNPITGETSYERPPEPLTLAQEATDKAFAKEYVDLQAAGGISDIDKNLNQLKEIKERLNPSNPNKENLTGGFRAVVPEFAEELLVPESKAVQERVEEVVQRNLRLVLGAQFTEKEGERLIKRAFNPKLSEEENYKRLSSLVDQLESAASAKKSAIQYFENNGTLRGWSGASPSQLNITQEDDPLGIR